MSMRVNPAAYVAARLSGEMGPGALRYARRATVQAERRGEGLRARLWRDVEAELARPSSRAPGRLLDMRV